MSSAGQQLIQAERKTFAICQQKRPSYSGENGVIQDRLDSQGNRHCRCEYDEKTAAEPCGNACMPADKDKKAEKNLGASLTVDKLAEAASLSPRQFSRAFLAETGRTPAKAVEKLRLEAARLMIEQSHHPIDVVARETGFVDRRRMRDAFLRTFGQPPQIIRRNARTEAPR